MSPASQAYTGLAKRAEFVGLGWGWVCDAARNFAATKASGEYLLFMDDDNVANSNEVRVLVAAAKATGADFLTPGNDYFNGLKAPSPDQAALGRWIPLGASPAVGFYQDCFGDSNHLARAAAFNQLGGFNAKQHAGSEDSTGEDWELFARATLQGYVLQVVPFPLFWYRQSATSLGQTTSAALYHDRTRRPYEAALPPSMQPMLRVAQGLQRARHDASVEQVSGAAARQL